MVRDNIADVIKAPEEIGENILNWFLNNEIKLNTDKCHLILNRQEPNTLKIGDFHINNSVSEKLLGTTFDCKLKFSKHIDDICQKALRIWKWWSPFSILKTLKVVIKSCSPYPVLKTLRAIRK